MRSAAIALLCLAGAIAHADAPLPDKTDRVIGLAKVWESVKVHHPYVWSRSTIDWDKALLAAIPKAEAAKTAADYRAAVAGMVAALGDPATHVLDMPAPSTLAPHPAVATPSKGIVAIDMTALITGGNADAAVKALGTATVAVVDLRTPPALGPAVTEAFEPLVATFPAITAWPVERSLEHHGFRTQDGMTSGGYFSTFVTSGDRAAKPAAEHGPRYVVAVVDRTSSIPPSIIALQRTGDASIVGVEPPFEANYVTTTGVDAGAGVVVEVRTGELVGPKPTVDVPVEQGSDPLLRALAFAKSKLTGRLPRRFTPIFGDPPPRVVDDDDYPAAAYPSRELRLLAGIRAWAILDTYWPYRDYATHWSGALREVLPLLDAAKDADAYRDALARLTAIAEDGHLGVYPAVRDPQGRRSGAAPFVARLVENKLAITQILDAAAAKGLAVGDVIDAIDGTPVATLIAKQLPLTAASTDDARGQYAAEILQFGRDGTTMKLSIGGRDVVVPRTAALRTARWAAAKTPHWKLLANGAVGYVDLRTLTTDEVPAMFTAVAATKTIVFDMRGYPNGTAWSIAPRINTKHAKYGAEFLQPIIGGDDGDRANLRVRFQQLLPELPPGATIYTGKIAVLIDDRAISQAEHTCLFFEAAAGATFIGSPTAGTNGDITTMRLPGGLRMSFTGQEPRHADGRQLQRIGITPTIAVRPTLAGLRAGKDEVLDRALVWAQTGK